jgi:hypothetical protein
MAAPSFVKASTGATDAGGAWTATGAIASAVGNVIIAQVLQDGNTATIAITGASNIENLAGTDNQWTEVAPGQFVGDTWAATQRLWIGRAINTTTAPTISGTNDTSEDLYWRFYEFTNVSTGTTLATVIENIGGTSDLYANGAGTSVTISDTGVTTSGPDRLALQLVAANDDIAIDAFAGETGGDWVEAVAEYAESSGTDGAVQLQTADVNLFAQLSAAGSGIAIGDGATRVYLAHSFTPTISASMAGVWILLGTNTGTPSDDLLCEVWSDSAAVPGSIIAGPTTVTNANLAASTWVYFQISASLTASTKYWISLRRSGAIDGSHYRRWQNASSDVLAGQQFRYDDSTPSTWPNSNSFDGVFRVVSAGQTINGGSDTVVSAAWGVVGFALIGTTVEGGGNTYTKAGYGKESG